MLAIGHADCAAKCPPRGQPRNRTRTRVLIWVRAMAQETELKLKVPVSDLSKVGHADRIRKKQAADKDAINVTSVYYDTRRRDLRRHGITLRLRRQRDKNLQTVKADVGNYPKKKEWETKISGNK